MIVFYFAGQFNKFTFSGKLLLDIFIICKFLQCLVRSDNQKPIILTRQGSRFYDKMSFFFQSRFLVVQRYGLPLICLNSNVEAWQLELPSIDVVHKMGRTDSDIRC